MDAHELDELTVLTEEKDFVVDEHSQKVAVEEINSMSIDMKAHNTWMRIIRRQLD